MNFWYKILFNKYFTLNNKKIIKNINIVKTINYKLRWNANKAYVREWLIKIL